VLRALVPLTGTSEEAAAARLAELAASLGGVLALGVSSVCVGAGSFQAGFSEARQAALAVPVVAPSAGFLRYESLGLFKYLLRVPRAERVRDPHADALRRLREHDRRRRSQLLPTLEEFLRQRGNAAATAKALYVHQNTLRQRFRRIEEISGINVRSADWLMLEIACKLLKFDEVYATDEAAPAEPAARPRKA
jgi:DNA-binding PucR family transcriptional regulator